MTEIGQGAFAEEALTKAEGFAGFAFEAFEQEIQLGDFDGGGVEVHAVDVVQQDAFSLGDGEGPSAAKAGTEDWFFAGGEGGGVGGCCSVLAVIPVEQELVGSDEEGGRSRRRDRGP